jgi:membrane protein DedA with SNARE-associated domain
MVGKLLGLLAAFVIGTITQLGYGGVVVLMAIESACIPLPSEVIMPFAGYLVSRGELNLLLVGVAGAVGCVLGSIVAYYVGAYGGRRVLERYGRYVLISARDLGRADRWFERWGEVSVFIGRLLPVVRTFIAFPAGVSRMAMGRFIAYTFAGSLIWSIALAYAGLQLGAHWGTLGGYFHRFDAVIGGLIVLAGAWWVWRHVREARPAAGAQPAEAAGTEEA